MHAGVAGMRAAFAPGDLCREDSVRTCLALLATAWLTASTHSVGAAGGPPGGGSQPQGSAACEAARCAAQAAIDTTCPCDPATSHGAYVRCVAHALKRAGGGKLVPARCKGSVVRCAARSTCGRPDAVACSVPVSGCNATSGTCANDATAACADDGDCGVRCRIAPSAARCQAAGGAVRASGTCCAGCGSPSGAFVGEMG